MATHEEDSLGKGQVEAGEACSQKDSIIYYLSSGSFQYCTSDINTPYIIINYINCYKAGVVLPQLPAERPNLFLFDNENDERKLSSKSPPSAFVTSVSETNLTSLFDFPTPETLMISLRL